MGLFRKKKNGFDSADTCDVANMMDNAMSIQGKAMVNQTELNIAYQAYSLLRWKDGFDHNSALSEAAFIVVQLEKELEHEKSIRG